MWAKSKSKVEINAGGQNLENLIMTKKTVAIINVK